MKQVVSIWPRQHERKLGYLLQWLKHIAILQTKSLSGVEWLSKGHFKVDTQEDSTAAGPGIEL